VSIEPSTRIRRNSGILAAGVADETILLDPADWTYISCNETAARIWEALDRSRMISEVVDMLQVDYDVDRATCEREVAAFVDELSSRGLLVVEAAT
jgi:coenzyme PQQ synthesis protein D (PqqD)